jgi:hypothetical protein
MAYSDNQDSQMGIVNFIDHPIISNSDSPSWPSRKFFAARWTGIISELSNIFDDALLFLPFDF